ncbi:uncharacterized protein LOC131161492 [Malania oleifera]|uniref:uncharacterized protein LOC131161492 n=1 Tax=Malania oleifera TaxID=397392 RepID=UPI0025AE1F62|nr:uncharacterized protein LOC131161492 [Malania oleifera]
MRQFGYRRGISNRFLTSGVDIVGNVLHDMDGHGRGVTYWLITHAIFVIVWEHRQDYIVPEVAEDGLMRPDDPYFTLYRPNTRRFVNRTTAVYLRLISSDPAIHRLMSAALDLIHKDGRRIPTRGGRPDVPARGRPAIVRGHASFSRPVTPIFLYRQSACLARQHRMRLLLQLILLDRRVDQLTSHLICCYPIDVIFIGRSFQWGGGRCTRYAASFSSRDIISVLTTCTPHE